MCNQFVGVFFIYLICRQHFLQVPHGLLSKHFEKLLACDAQLTELSRQPTIILDSPFFDPKSSSVDDEADKAHDLHHIKIEYGSPSFSALQEAASSDTVEFVKSQHLLSQDNPSTSSGTFFCYKQLFFIN